MVGPSHRLRSFRARWWFGLRSRHGARAGEQVELSRPVPEFDSDYTLWGTSYDIYGPDGALCASVDWDPNDRRVTITVDDETVGLEPLGLGARYVCPDGVAYESTNPTWNCGAEANVLNGGLPIQAFLYDSNDDVFAGGFYGTESNGDWLFACDFEP